MRFWRRCLLLCWAGCLGTAYAGDDIQVFDQIFRNWTHEFNQKNYPKVCDLFSEKLNSNYQGALPKNFSTTCHGFQKIFSEKNKTYHNEYQIHQVYLSGDLAVVRITWYLTIFKNQVCQSLTQEEGMDIFEKQKTGEWKIVNFIAYPIEKNCPASKKSSHL